MNRDPSGTYAQGGHANWTGTMLLCLLWSQRSGFGTCKMLHTFIYSGINIQLNFLNLHTEILSGIQSRWWWRTSILSFLHERKNLERSNEPCEVMLESLKCDLQFFTSNTQLLFVQKHPFPAGLFDRCMNKETQKKRGHNPERWREWRRCVTLWPRCKPWQHETRIINPGLHYPSTQKHKSIVGFGHRFCFHARDPETPECRDSIYLLITCCTGWQRGLGD